MYKPTLVIAFDGLIADTLPIRAGAVSLALSNEGITINADDAMPYAAGRSLHEAVRAAAGGRIQDETALDLAGFVAVRQCNLDMQGAVALQPVAQDWISRAAMKARIGIRAESRRADVERVLDAADLTPYISFVVAGDEVTSTLARTTFETGWQRIRERLAGRGEAKLIGIEPAGEEICRLVPDVQFIRVSSLAEVPVTLPL